MRPIRYIGRHRNAGYGYSLLDRLRCEIAQELVQYSGWFGYIAPRWKREKWERIAGLGLDEGEMFGLARAVDDDVEYEQAMEDYYRRELRR